MNVKQLRDYLNSLDLDNVQTKINIVSVVDDRSLQIDNFGDIILVCPECGHKPYLSIYTEEAIDVCNAD